MSKEFTIGTATAAPGNKATGHVMIGTRPDGSSLGIPVTVLNGAKDGPTLCVDAGVHGDELEGMLAMMELARAIDPRKLSGRFVGAHAVNVPAFEAGRRGNPLDNFIWDLNRVFPGQADGFLTERIAHLYLSEVVSKADMVISFHCGANHHYLAEKIAYEAPESLALAKAMGPDFDVLWTGAPFGDSTLSGQCRKMGKPCVAVELGGESGRLPKMLHHNVATTVRGVLNAMKHFGMLEGRAEYPREWMIMEETRVPSNYGGLLVSELGFEFKQMVKKGTTLLRVFSLFGEELEQIKAPFDGLFMGLRTYPRVQVGDWVLFMGKVVERMKP